MGYIITRNNGKVTQIWQSDPDHANWSFFLGGMSRDVHWENIQFNPKPKIFYSFENAKYHLDTRKKFLKGYEKQHDHEWEYHILEKEGD